MTARKIMLLGEIGVGKSSIARRLVFDRFEGDYKPTIGVDVYSYDVEPGPAGPQPPIKFIIWDTSARRCFRTSTSRRQPPRSSSAM
jgi:Ras-related protein Rab-5C